MQQSPEAPSICLGKEHWSPEQLERRGAAGVPDSTPWSLPTQDCCSKPPCFWTHPQLTSWTPKEKKWSAGHSPRYLFKESAEDREGGRAGLTEAAQTLEAASAEKVGIRAGKA